MAQQVQSEINVKKSSMNITQIGRFGMLLMMASVAISCSDPNPLDSYTRVPFEKAETDDGNSDGDGDGVGGLFEKGNGTDSKPYMIMNATQIRNMRSVLKSGIKVYFQLGADIDMACPVCGVPRESPSHRHLY